MSPLVRLGTREMLFLSIERLFYVSLSIYKSTEFLSRKWNKDRSAFRSSNYYFETGVKIVSVKIGCKVCLCYSACFLTRRRSSFSSPPREREEFFRLRNGASGRGERNTKQALAIMPIISLNSHFPRQIAEASSTTLLSFSYCNTASPCPTYLKTT